MVKHKESSSDSEGALPSEERQFRIAVCLRRFYSDHRGRALLYVSARRRVRWLQRRLRRLFALPPALLLLRRGHLLPQDEPLALLDRDDLLEVLPAPADPEPALGDLSEGKRRALLVLDQYCAGDDAVLGPTAVEEAATEPAAAEAATEAAAAEAATEAAATEAATEAAAAEAATEAAAVESAPRVKRRRVRRRRRAAVPPPRDPSCHVPNEEHSLGSAGDVLREPQPAAAVLRNDLHPRAPRLIRDVSRSDVLSCDVTRCDVSQSDVSQCDVPRRDVSRCDVSLSTSADMTCFTKIFA